MQVHWAILGTKEASTTPSMCPCKRAWTMRATSLCLSPSCRRCAHLFLAYSLDVFRKAHVYSASLSLEVVYMPVIRLFGCLQSESMILPQHALTID